MSADRVPRIIYVPGKNPKPPADQYQRQLRRCLLEGVRKADPDVHADLAALPDCLSLIAWNHDYYGRYADFDDSPWVDRLIEKPEAAPEDMREARHWRVHVGRISHLIADRFPALIGLVRNPRLRASIEDTAGYFENREGIAEKVRRPLIECLRRYGAEGAPILLIGHSLGSVIAWDALWTASHLEPVDCDVDLFLSLGSPLGMRFVQQRLLGHDAFGPLRYPAKIRRWVNVTAVGDPYAIDPHLRNDFGEMVELGLVESIRDYETPVYTWFRSPQFGLNVHRSYGYLVTREVGSLIAGWWKEAKAAA
jgi:hypothetical protein